MMLTLVVAGCGAKANDDASPTVTTERSESSSTTGNNSGSTTTEGDTASPSTTNGDFGNNGTIPSIPGGADSIHDALVQGFVAGGMTKKQAECLADGYEKLGFTDPSGPGKDLDVTKIVDLLEQCDVSISDFSGGGLSPGASIPGN